MRHHFDSRAQHLLHHHHHHPFLIHSSFPLPLLLPSDLSFGSYVRPKYYFPATTLFHSLFLSQSLTLSLPLPLPPLIHSSFRLSLPPIYHLNLICGPKVISMPQLSLSRSLTLFFLSLTLSLSLSLSLFLLPRPSICLSDFNLSEDRSIGPGICHPVCLSISFFLCTYISL